jgi:hypothetical protein
MGTCHFLTKLRSCIPFRQLEPPILELSEGRYPLFDGVLEEGNMKAFANNVRIARVPEFACPPSPRLCRGSRPREPYYDPSLVSKKRTIRNEIKEHTSRPLDARLEVQSTGGDNAIPPLKRTRTAFDNHFNPEAGHRAGPGSLINA